MNPESEEKAWLRWYDPILLNVAVPCFALLIKLLMLSCRVMEVKGLSREKEALERSGGNAIYSAWHQRISYLTHYLGFRNVTAMVSRSRDGEYAARVVKWLGIDSIRGSSTRGGQRALVEMIQRLRKGESSGMLVDGPLGPARVIKIGAVIMAHKARVPLIPITWGADRCWIFNSWDRFMIPKPFSRVVVSLGEPLWIPPGARGEEREAYRRLLQERLNESNRWCDEQLGEERPWRKVTEKGLPEKGPLPGG